MGALRKKTFEIIVESNTLGKTRFTVKAENAWDAILYLASRGKKGDTAAAFRLSKEIKITSKRK